jgi:hypothetical protein
VGRQKVYRVKRSYPVRPQIKQSSWPVAMPTALPSAAAQPALTQFHPLGLPGRPPPDRSPPGLPRRKLDPTPAGFGNGPSNSSSGLAFVRRARDRACSRHTSLLNQRARTRMSDCEPHAAHGPPPATASRKEPRPRPHTLSTAPRLDHARAPAQPLQRQLPPRTAAPAQRLRYCPRHPCRVHLAARLPRRLAAHTAHFSHSSLHPQILPPAHRLVRRCPRGPHHGRPLQLALQPSPPHLPSPAGPAHPASTKPEPSPGYSRTVTYAMPSFDWSPADSPGELSLWPAPSSTTTSTP